MRLLIVIFALFIIFCNLHSEIRINEVCSSNSQSYFDEDMQSPDWVELINTSDTALSLAGYRISTNNNFDKAWTLQDTVLQPEAMMLLSCSGKNSYSNGALLVRASGMGITPYVLNDAFRYEYFEIKGDFDIRVRIKSLRDAELFGNAGLVFKEDLTDVSRFAAVLGLVDIRVVNMMLYRDIPGEYPKSDYFVETANYPNKYLGLKRQGDTIYSIIYDKEWYPCQKKSLYFPVQSSQQYIGLAVSAYSNEHYAEACFDELALDGKKIDYNELKTIEMNCPSPGKRYISKEYNTDFKIDRAGSVLYLWNRAGTLIDTLAIPPLPRDCSFGRFPDGSDKFYFYDKPSPCGKSTIGYTGITKMPTLDTESGIYPAPLTVKFGQFDDNTTVFYTTDGSEPDSSSQLAFSGQELYIDSSQVIRARAFKPSFLPGAIMTKSFIIGEDTKLPVLSLSGDPKSFFNPDTGFFAPGSVYWENKMPVSFEFWDKTRNISYSSDASITRHGSTGSAQPPCSMKFYSNSIFGDSKFKVKFFGDSPLNTFNKFVLRNAGQDKVQAYLRDGLYYVFTKDMGNVSSPEYQPVIVYINGKFWSLMNLRAHLNEEYLAEKYKLPIESISIMKEGGRLKYGACRTYMELIDSLPYLDLSDSADYSFVDNRCDLENLADYMAVEFYSGHEDFPDLNRRFWNSIASDKKWKWLLYDLDLSTDISVNSSWDNKKFESVMQQCDSSDFNFRFSCLFKGLLDNTNFRTLFLNSVADLLNSHFLPGTLYYKIDSTANLIKNDIPRQRELWKETCVDWDEHIERIKLFTQLRPDFFRNSLAEYYSLDCISNLYLKINKAGSGKIIVNRITVRDTSWNGKYFCGVPVRLQAIATEGRKFEKWDISDSSLASQTSLTDSVISVLLPDSVEITAFFSKSYNKYDSLIVINEIMHKAAKKADCGDWIELYNPSSKPLVLSGWTLKDDDDNHIFTFANNDTLKPDEYLVICNDIAKFEAIYPNVSHHRVELGFGLSASDAIRIYDAKNTLADIVDYDENPPWDLNVDGSGFSMELISPELDNALAENWQTSYIKGGTPGRKNSVWSSIGDLIYPAFQNVRIFPCPVKSSINIEINLPETQLCSIEIRDIFGRVVFAEKQNYFNMGHNRKTIDISNIYSIQNGIYNIIINGNKATFSSKFIVLR